MTRRIIRGVRVATPAGIEPASVFIEDGRIAYVAGYEDIPRQGKVEELAKSVLMPGLTLSGASKHASSALLGGITSLISGSGSGVEASELPQYLSARWTEMREQDQRLETLIDILCSRPAAQAGLGDSKGRIEVGYDADFVVWNPEYTVTGTRPLLYGLIRQVIVAGQTRIKEGQPV